LLEGWSLGRSRLNKLREEGSLSAGRGLGEAEAGWPPSRTGWAVHSYVPVWDRLDSLWILRPRAPRHTRRCKA